jgi:nucleotide-binding universal stress UspA family protein
VSDGLSGIVFAVLVLVTWVALGVAAVVFLGRHGRRSRAWYVIGVALGPILVPIAVELAQRDGVLLARTVDHDERQAARMTALAAVDGSQESADALADAVRVLAPKGARFILLTVIDPDLEGDADARKRAETLVADRASTLPPGALPPVLEVASGEPARVILDRAAADHVDLVVVGRRGRGVSEMLLGSVADQVVRRSPRPVLLGTAPARHGH